MDVTSNPLIDSDLAQAMSRKVRESVRVKEQVFAEQGPRIVGLCRRMAEAFRQGGRLFVMGNGGSACDAQHVAVEFAHPIIEKRRPLPALSLSTDPVLLTAIGNDRDFSKTFSEQVRLLGRPGDMLLGFSTSGHSANVLQAIRIGKELGLFTIGFTGMDGGKLADTADCCLVVPSFSIHRIQEAHVLMFHLLWDLVHVVLGEEDVL